jgi:hypothetical protein
MPRDGGARARSVRGAAVLKPERIAMARDTIFDLASLASRSSLRRP